MSDLDSAKLSGFVSPAGLYEQASAHRLDFWGEQAHMLDWGTPWNQVLDWSRAPSARWFLGGKLNAAHNCVDRHVLAGRGDRVALHWVGEPLGETRDITYAQLRDEVCGAANGLIRLGVGKGDRVAIYMPMIPEAVVAMLACARIGALHTVVFGGFSAEALTTRIEDFGAKVVITADGGFRRGSVSPLKPTVDEARAKTSLVERVVVVRRTGEDVAWDHDVDVWWHDLMYQSMAHIEPEQFDSEHPLFVMYTSGTTGKPKGILHTTGGYLVSAAFTHRAVFDLRPETDVYWCTADIGWITGHSYLVYGPLANGVTQVLYEGTPDAPERGRWWQIVQDYNVSILYTAPTAVRSFMKQGEDIPSRFDLSSLRILGSVGEPINPEAYNWYRRVIGGNRTPIVDTWWQTETGAIMVSPLPGGPIGKPGSAMRPLPGIDAAVVDDSGNAVAPGEDGLLVLTSPWPSMARTVWGDDERFKETYWSMFSDKGWYFAGDGARVDEDGDLWVLGRVDDVMNVSGHRLSSAEIESALVSHPAVAEAAVVGMTDADTGQAVCAFVILRENAVPDRTDDRVDIRDVGMVEKLRQHVRREIGAIATPRLVLVVPELPKTRSGKIMRRLLRDVADERAVGDTTALADDSVMSAIAAGMQSTTQDT